MVQAKTALPVREVVKRSGRTRAAVYKALTEGRLTAGDSFGVLGVIEDSKLKAFFKKAKGGRNGAKGRP